MLDSIFDNEKGQKLMFSVADLDLAEGVDNPKNVTPTHYFGHLSGKLHEIEKIGAGGGASGGGYVPSAPWIRQWLCRNESRNSVKRGHEI